LLHKYIILTIHFYNFREPDYEEIRKRFPHSTITYIPDAGHFVHSEKPTEFLEAALEFILS